MIKTFKNLFDDNLHYVPAPKVASRTTLGWMMLMREPGLYRHKDWFPEVPQKQNHAYKQIKRLIKTEHIETSEGKTVFCVKRDPVKRFISAYQNMQWLGHLSSIQNLINEWDVHMTQNKMVKAHFRTQTECYGSDPAFFTHTFHHSNMTEVREFLEDYAKVHLPNLHLQQSGEKREANLTKEQEDWIVAKYQIDYDNGWF